MPLFSGAFIDKARVTQDDEPKLLEPFLYYRNFKPGKGRRRNLLQAFNLHLNISEDWLEGIAAIVEDLHTSSLLIDDIEDNSPLRRGAPSAHVRYGLPPTLNSGNYVYFLAMKKLVTLADQFGADSQAMTTIFMEEMLELHRGQGMEIWWRQNHVLPSLDQYIVMVERKTGGLLRLSVRLLQCHPDCPKEIDLSSIAEDIGILYQIRDDYINLASTSYADEKGFAEDISEGKYSFPIIHSLIVDPDSGLAEILHGCPEDIPTKEKAISLIAKTGSFEYTVECLKQVETKLFDKLADLGGNPRLEHFLDELSVKKLVDQPVAATCDYRA